VKVDAIALFTEVVGDTHRVPDWFHYDEWHQIMVLRQNWCDGACVQTHP
jgi:hypothetical protein